MSNPFTVGTKAQRIAWLKKRLRGKLTITVSDIDRVVFHQDHVIPGWREYNRPKIGHFTYWCRWWLRPLLDFVWGFRWECWRIRAELSLHTKEMEHAAWLESPEGKTHEMRHQLWCIQNGHDVDNARAKLDAMLDEQWAGLLR